MRAASMLPSAAEYYTLHRDPAAPAAGAWPVGVDDLQDVRRLNPGPGVRGLMSIAARQPGRL